MAFQIPDPSATAQPVIARQAMGDSQNAYGTVTTPAAGAAIATLAAPGAGKYEIRVIPGYGGGVQETQMDNMQLQIGAAVISKLAAQAVLNGAPVLHVFRRIDVPAGAAITVNAVALATTGAIYRAHIVATPVP